MVFLMQDSTEGRQNSSSSSTIPSSYHPLPPTTTPVAASAAPMGPAPFSHHPAAAPLLGPLVKDGVPGVGGVVPRLGGPDSLFYRAAAPPPSFQQQRMPHPFSAPGLPALPPATSAPKVSQRVTTYSTQ